MKEQLFTIQVSSIQMMYYHYFLVLFMDDDKVSIQNDSLLYNSGDSVDITWSPELLQSDEKVEVSMYEVQEASDGTLIHKKIAVLANDLPNSGKATLTIPQLNARSKRDIGSFLYSGAVKVASVGSKVAQWTSSIVAKASDVTGYALCQVWSAIESVSTGTDILNSVKETAPCPPNVGQANPELSPWLVEDGNTWQLGFFHPGASKCFRQKEASR